MQHIDCIITAAGLSSRMGQWKMMLPWQQGTILDASIKNARQFCSRIILVTGFRGDELHQRYAETDNLLLVNNSDYNEGLFSSLIAGARHVESEYCFITHGDIPCLNEKIFNELWQLRGDYALIPQHNGTPGHPVLINQPTLHAAVNQRQTGSMRSALLAGKHRCIEMKAPEIIFDIDTPQDFIKLQDNYRQ
ncbi:molybdenum cofactor cytidylyltransferase [Trabulsiella odontotermitis]|uniref:Molybdenum cofactor cytidylyltransferase n=1 Tax=Trabulsiella odontotermitis TaxID=379893 RepID=A0A0L0H3E2_9ENTR|nr:molybdenum cofactor cytidylyltransferase [Trabulsiella odontotermitis]KNC95712.1 molybdenum cofactor cytidylyltransferase [Trabulsiella odontotermitis]